METTFTGTQADLIALLRGEAAEAAGHARGSKPEAKARHEGRADGLEHAAWIVSHWHPEAGPAGPNGGRPGPLTQAQGPARDIAAT